MSAFLRIIGVALVIAVGISAAASAQEIGTPPVPAVELSAGYTFLRDFTDSTNAINFPFGWYASTTVNLNRSFGLVGEVTGSYKNNLNSGIEELSVSANTSEHTFMGGPRFAGKTGRVMPFAQFLAGAAHVRASMDMPIELPGHFTASATKFAFQPGGGVNVLVTDNLGMHVGADYRCIVDNNDGGDTTYVKQFRFVTGLTFNWGAR